MFQTDLKLYLLIFPFFPCYNSHSSQLPVSKDFPVFSIIKDELSDLPCVNFLHCLTSQIYDKIGSDKCDISIILDPTISIFTYSPPENSIRQCMVTSALELNLPRSVSNDMHFISDQERLHSFQIYQHRYTTFCRIVIAEDWQISILEDTHNVFSAVDVFDSFYILFATPERLQTAPQNYIDLFQKLRYIIYLSCDGMKDDVPPNNQYSKEASCPNFLISSLNWNLSPLIATSDPTAPAELSYHQNTGKWTSFMLAAYQFTASRINATNDLILIFNAPKSKSFENGSWDDYVGPLAHKRAHISTIRVPYFDDEHYIYYTVPCYFDYFTFMTAIPRDSGSNGLHASLDYILFILAALSSTTSAICFVILLENLFLNNRKNDNRIFWSYVIEILKTTMNVLQRIIKPILDQPLMNPGKDLNVIRPHYVIFALWLAMVLALSSLYKCNFISDIVNPNLEYIPNTFEGLIESDFTIKAIFFKGNLELRFAGVSNPVNEAVLKRTQDCLFFDPTV